MPRKTIPRNVDSSGQNSRSVSRRNVLRAGAAGAAVIGGMSLAGCLGEDAEHDYEVAIISSSAGFDDNAFNDNALEGLEQAAEEWDIGINDVEETDQAAYESLQADLAEEGIYDVIVCVSSEHMDALETNAEEYGDQNWMLINDHTGHDNVSGWIEMNNEMCFLAGAAAAAATQEELEHGDSTMDTGEAYVGFVGGEENDLIQAFEQSYIDGIEWYDDTVEYTTGYADSFSDSSAANDVADSQFEDGVDLAFHAASAAGTGVFSSAQENERFAFGVDVDQSITEDQYADVIVGSATKELDAATYEVAEAIANDDWDSVSGEQNLTTEDGGIDFIIGQEFDGDVPHIEEAVDQAKDAIIEGEADLECGPTGC